MGLGFLLEVLRPFLLPLFTGVRGRGVLGTSLRGGSRLLFVKQRCAKAPANLP